MNRPRRGRDGERTRGGAKPGSRPERKPQRGAFAAGKPKHGALSDGKPQRGAFSAAKPKHGRFSEGTSQRGAFSEGKPQRGAFSAAKPKHGAFSDKPQRGGFSEGKPQRGKFSAGKPQRSAFSGGKPNQGAFSGGKPSRGAFSGGEAKRGAFSGGKPNRGSFSGGKPQRGASPGRGPSAHERRAEAYRPLASRPVSAAPRRVFPTVKPGPAGHVRAGEWLFTTRPGAEQDLIEELYFLDERSGPRPAGPSLVASASLPKRRDQGQGGAVSLAFARQGLLVSEVLAPADPNHQPRAIAAAIVSALEGASRKPKPWAFDLWVPDADVSNPLSAAAAELAARTRAAFAEVAPAAAALLTSDARAALADNGLYAQACLLPDSSKAAADRATPAIAVGVGWARDALSLAPGGRLRIHVPAEAPSRAAMKLVEALTWLDRSPEPGDLCVDLGAAPGGWTWVLLERRARVIAVDPANLDRSLIGRKGLIHARADAFRFEPDQPLADPVDWLFCDMAWRPLEAAGLLAKWARRKWARLLVANIKLPMRKKAEHLFRVRDILEDAGWSNVRVRQLYHDRDEVTIGAVRI
ncbi:MAG TPA: SAM-dependent methyltransferase, partial [Polyangia bacterium]